MLLGFKKQFIHPILSEVKGFTLRNKRKHTPKIGKTLYMYCGLQTKYSELITSNYKLKYQYPTHVLINTTSNSLIVEITINSKKLAQKHLFNFCRMDGFKGLSDFVEYWTEGKEEVQISSFMMMYGWIELPKEWGV